jgi:hypothetical protein
MLRESLWISMGIYVDNWKIRVDICAYSIQSYLHAGRPVPVCEVVFVQTLSLNAVDRILFGTSSIPLLINFNTY